MVLRAGYVNFMDKNKEAFVDIKNTSDITSLLPVKKSYKKLFKSEAYQLREITIIYTSRKYRRVILYTRNAESLSLSIYIEDRRIVSHTPPTRDFSFIISLCSEDRRSVSHTHDVGLLSRSATSIFKPFHTREYHRAVSRADNTGSFFIKLFIELFHTQNFLSSFSEISVTGSKEDTTYDNSSGDGANKDTFQASIILIR